MEDILNQILSERGLQPRPHQVRNILDYSSPDKPHVAAIATAGGKTIMSAAKFELYYRCGLIMKDEKVLILPADKTILRGNFVKQFNNFFYEDEDCTILKGEKSFTYCAVEDKMDLQVAIENGVQPPTTNQAQPNNGQNNNSPIGTVTSSVAGTGQTGTINYSVFMDKMVEETQTYFTNVVNKNKEAFNQYNNAIRQQWMMERTYQDGKFLQTKTTNTVLFGKPYNLEKRIDNIFEELVKDIENGNEGFIEFLKENINCFQDWECSCHQSLIRTMKFAVQVFLNFENNFFSGRQLASQRL